MGGTSGSLAEYMDFKNKPVFAPPIRYTRSFITTESSTERLSVNSPNVTHSRLLDAYVSIKLKGELLEILPHAKYSLSW
jgi:hypothetical protein